MTSTTKPGGPTESFEFQELPRATAAGTCAGTGTGTGTGTAQVKKTKTKIKGECPSGESLPSCNKERDRDRDRDRSRPQPLNNYYCCIEQKESEEALFNWLYSLQLIHHFEKFLDHGYEDLGICMEIGETDLHAIGVSDIHERLALLQAVRQLRQQNQSQATTAGSPTGTGTAPIPISKISDFNLYNKYEYEFTNSSNNTSNVSIFGGGGKNSKNNKMQIQSIPLRSISSTQGHTTIPSICSSWSMPQHSELPTKSQSQTVKNKKKSSAPGSGSSSSPFGFSFSLRSKKSSADKKSSTIMAATASSKNGKKSTDDIIIMDQYGCDWKSNTKNYQSQILSVNGSNSKTMHEKQAPQFKGAKRPTNFKTQLPPQGFINSATGPNPNNEPAIGIAALTNNGIRKSQFSQFAIHANSKLPPLSATCYPSCMSSSVSSNLKLNPHGFLHGGGSGSLVALNTIGVQPPIPGPGPPPPPCSRRNLQLRNSNFPPPPPLPLHSREFQEFGNNGGNLRKMQLASKLSVQSSPGEEIIDHPNYVDVNEDGEVVEPLYETVSPVRAVPRPGPVQHLRDFHHFGFGYSVGNTYHHGRGHHHDDMCGYSIPMNNFPTSRSTPITPKKQQKNVFKNSHHIINNNNSHHAKNQIQSQSSCCHHYDDENVGDSNLNSTNNCQSFPCCGGGSGGGNGNSGSVSVSGPVSGSVPNPDHHCQQSSVNLVLLRSQLRDQVMQDGINISRISDESILRTMAAQYAAELASTLTLTPSSNSACSSSTSTSSNSSCVSAPLSHQSASSSAASSSGASSNSSGSCSISGQIISASTPTPADLHYQQVYHQLRELWLEERMKLFPVIQQQHPQNYSLDSPGSVSVNSKSLGCTCGPGPGPIPGQSQGQGILNFKNPNAPHIPSPLGLGLGIGFPFKSSSCSSTPAVTTPTGAGPGHNPNGTGTGSPAGLLFHGNANTSGSESGAKISSAGGGSGSGINNGGSNSNLNSKSSGGCKSPERSVGQHQHQYLQHVIISNSSFGQQQSHNFMSESNSNLNKSSQSNNSSSSHNCEGGNGAASAAANTTSTTKQTYKPGIYLPSSCLLDKDEIYDYAPPVRVSPERVINNNSNSNTSQNLYSPSKRCFVGQKGGLTSPRHSNGNVNNGNNGNGNGIATIRGSSKSSYALATDHRGTLNGSNNNGNSIYGPGGNNSNYAHLSPGSAGSGGVKPGCRTLANLSKLSRRLGLSRLFRTLRIHGNGNSESNGNGAGAGAGAGAGNSNGNGNIIGGEEGHGNGMSMTRTSNPSFCGSSSGSGSSGRTNTNDMCSNENYSCGGNGNGNGARASSYFNESHLNSELNSISQRLYGSSSINQNVNQNQRFSQTNTLPDLTMNQGNGTKGNGPVSGNDKGSTISSLPSNERIIETINRLKLEELQKRKERIAQEHQMVRDTLFYMLPRN